MSLNSPEGIEARHIHEAGGARWQVLPVGLIGLGLLLLASVLGLFGTEDRLAASDGGVELSVEAPMRIRSGEFYEMVVRVDAREPIADLVLLVGEGVWHDVTVNTFIPAASEEGFRDGAFEFAFGPLEAGGSLLVKVDCQVNPDHAPTGNEGTVAVADGDGAPLAELDYVMEVLP